MTRRTKEGLPAVRAAVLKLGQAGGTYVEATLVLLVWVVEVPPGWLPPGVDESE